ncbi:MAG: HlyC/CorC family transporter [Gammaproteobacteria bacterium]|nr:HlyC/CorC family transporter [Gammaproteobacteria bacterium]
METVLWLKLGLIIFLVMGNAYFVGSEVALTAARRTRIKQLADTGNKSAKHVQVLHNEPERFYSVTQIGITMVSMGLGAIGIVTIEQLVDPWFEAASHLFGEDHVVVDIAHTMAYVFGFVFISFLHVVGGELAPKVLAFHKAENISLAVAWSINGLYKSFRWVIWVMEKSSNGLLWLFGQRDLTGGHGAHFSMSEDEIRTILSASEREGVLNPDETKMIRGVFDLDEHRVRDAMVPRTDIIAVSRDDKVEDVLRLFNEGHHARYPVYEGNLDNMVGMVAIKDLLTSLADVGPSGGLIRETQISELMRPAYLIPESKPLSGLLKEFKRLRQQMAVVVDEYGGTAGVITLEDILEEIVGEYEDEFTPHQSRYIKKLSGSQYIIDASIRASDLEHLVNFPFPSGDFVTLGGLIYQELGRIPEVGDVVSLEGGKLEVLEMDKHRITKVLFQDLALNAETGETQLAEGQSPPSSDNEASESAPLSDTQEQSTLTPDEISLVVEEMRAEAEVRGLYPDIIVQDSTQDGESTEKARKEADAE